MRIHDARRLPLTAAPNTSALGAKSDRCLSRSATPLLRTSSICGGRTAGTAPAIRAAMSSATADGPYRCGRCLRAAGPLTGARRLKEEAMSRVRVHNFSVSLDGCGTGEGQSLDAPFGHAGTRLHEWFFPTRTFRAMQGQPGGSTGIDDAFASAWGPGIGAEIM